MRVCVREREREGGKLRNPPSPPPPPYQTRIWIAVAGKPLNKVKVVSLRQRKQQAGIYK